MTGRASSGGSWLRESGGRPRTGWRILAFVLAFAALNALVSTVVRLAGGPPKAPVTRSLLLGLLLAGTATLAVAFCRRRCDRRGFAALGLEQPRRGALDALFGFALSAAMVAAIFAGLRGMGWLRLVEGPAPAAPELWLLLVGVGLAVGYWEELVFRGYLLQNLRDGLGLRAAIAVSCLLYGLVHAANPNATLLSAVLIAAIGYLRIHGWLATGQLWLSMGLHAGWNFCLGPVFGFAVSGRRSPSLVHHELLGPAWATGGAFGPEAGAAVLIVLVPALLAISAWARARATEGKRE